MSWSKLETEEKSTKKNNSYEFKLNQYNLFEF